MKGKRPRVAKPQETFPGLFQGIELREFLESCIEGMKAAIGQLKDRELKQSTEKLAASLGRRFAVAAPTIADVPRAEKPSRLDKAGDSVVYCLGFKGDPQFLAFRPSIAPIHRVAGGIRAGGIELRYGRLDFENDAAKLMAAYRQDAAQVVRYVEAIRSEIDEFNRRLPERAAVEIEARRERLEQEARFWKAFGQSAERRPA